MSVNILDLSFKEIDEHFPEQRFNEIAKNTKRSYCDKILQEHLERWIKTNKIPGEFSECKISEDLFFDKFYVRKKRNRFVNSDKFKGRIQSGLIDIFIAVTKDKEGNYEKIYWYTLLNVPKDAKPNSLCVKGTIKFKEDDNIDLFDRFNECAVEALSDDEAPDSDDDNRKKVYKSLIVGKVRKVRKGAENTVKETTVSQAPTPSKEMSDVETASTGGGGGKSDDETATSTGGGGGGGKSDDETATSTGGGGGGGKSDDDDDESSEEEVEVVKKNDDPFKNKTTFQEYLKENDLRSKKVFKANIEEFEKDVQEKFKGISKTQDFVNMFFKLKIIPKKI
jgi:hypothetical protein